MWVTQTYLNSPEPSAKVHVYYLFQDYNDIETKFTRLVQGELGKIGHQFGGNASILMPQNESAAHIAHELRELTELWDMVYNQLPGLLISSHPLEHSRFSSGDYFYVDLKNGKTPDQAAHIIADVSRILHEKIDYEYRQPDVKEVKPRRESLWDAVELKPGIFGFKIDLKKLVR